MTLPRVFVFLKSFALATNPTARLSSLLVVSLFALATAAGCSAFAAEGERCVATDDCERALACVIVRADAAFCLPRPADRGQRSCSADDDCRLSDDQLWPVETECLDGACRCLSSEVRCGDDEDVPLVLEEETCRCVARGTEGDACVTSHTCGLGFACTAGECVSAPGELGAACSTSGECTRGQCLEIRDFGICR